MKVAARAPNGARVLPENLLRRLLRRLHFTGVFWYRFHLFAVRAVPEWLKPPVLACSALGFFLALGEVRRVLAQNHELLWGRAGRWTRMRRVFRTIHTFAWCLTERYEQFVPNKRSVMRVENPQAWEELTSRNTGVLVVTSHIGGWELGSVVPSQTGLDQVVHVVREAEVDPRAQEFIRGLTARLGGAGYVTHFAGDDLGLGLVLLNALRRGETVALQTDRPREAGKVERVRMLDAEVALPVGPAALARAAGVPMLPVFVFREGRSRYRVVFRERVHVARTADRERDLHDAIQELAHSIEWAIRQDPAQWFCFADLRFARPARGAPLTR